MEKDDLESGKHDAGPLKPRVGSDDGDEGVGSERGGGVGSEERDRPIYRKPAPPRHEDLPGSAPAKDAPDFCDAELPGDGDTKTY